jgi:hypothetical protein
VITFKVYPTIDPLERRGSSQGIAGFAYEILEEPEQWRVIRLSHAMFEWRFERRTERQGKASVVEGGQDMRDVAYLVSLGYRVLDWPAVCQAIEYFPETWRCTPAGYMTWHFAHRDFPVQYQAQGFEVEVFLMSLQGQRDEEYNKTRREGLEMIARLGLPSPLHPW